MMRPPVLPVDPQMVDETGRPWAWLSEARDRSVVTAGAILVVGPPEDPLLARVVEVVPDDDDHLVYLDIVGPVAAVERAIHAA